MLENMFYILSPDPKGSSISMPFVARQAPQANSQSPVPMSTTTIYTQPTVTNAPPPNSGVTVPVAAIVGGVIGGMLLAIIITAGWICWGKSIKRSSTRQRSEAVSPSHHTHNKDQVPLSSPSRKHHTEPDPTQCIMQQCRSHASKHTDHYLLVLQTKRSDLREKIGEMRMMGKRKTKRLTVGSRR